jgi:adenosylcobinamide kinase/adenosylcobinamide-phosphate guanylyltransferase
MHFVSGGAFQGKRKWVKAHYSLANKPHIWCNGYEEEWFLPNDHIMEQIVVFEGAEQWIRRMLNEHGQESMKQIVSYFTAWKTWEMGGERTVVWIGCEIGQGIVPLDEKERIWRDIVGWSYQRLVAMCDRVDRLWCGIAERIK